MPRPTYPATAAHPPAGAGHRRRRRVTPLLLVGLAAWSMVSGMPPPSPAGAQAGSPPVAASPAGPVDLRFDTVALGAPVPSGGGARAEVGAGGAREPVPAGSAHGVDLVTGSQMLAFSWSGAPHGSIRIRTRSGGTWSGWTGLEGDDDEGPDVSAGRSGAGPVWLGDPGVDRVEVRVGPRALADFEVLRMHWDEPAPAAADTVTATATRAARPLVRARSSWAPGGWRGDLAGCSKTVDYLPQVDLAVVHHTVTGNSYSSAEVPGILAGIYRYHTESLGWCDIAYNFVIDRFGGIWQGRSGDIDRNPMGGHTRGFNSFSVGIALLGQYQPGVSPSAARPANAQIGSLERLLAWKLGREVVDPTATVRVRSRGSNKFPAGSTVTLPAVTVHGDTAYTACPGDYVRARMGEVRQVTRSLTGPLRPDPGVAPFRRRWALVERQARDFYGRNASPLDLWTGLTWFSQGRTAGQVVAGLAEAPDVTRRTHAVVRLWYAAFGGAPDTAALTAWREQAQKGMSTAVIAQYLVASSRFQARYGGSDADYVAALYRNILGRPGDPDLAAGHVARLRSGAETRASLLVRFSESAENVRNTIPRVRTIATYHAMLGRVPTPESLARWSGRPSVELTTAVLASPEYADQIR